MPGLNTQHVLNSEDVDILPVVRGSEEKPVYLIPSIVVAIAPLGESRRRMTLKFLSVTGALLEVWIVNVARFWKIVAVPDTEMKFSLLVPLCSMLQK